MFIYSGSQTIKTQTKKFPKKIMRQYLNVLIGLPLNYLSSMVPANSNRNDDTITVQHEGRILSSIVHMQGVCNYISM